jgi:hypothetical protein
MFPINAIPVSGTTKFQTFYASGTDWQAWQKPAGCSMVYIFMLASGGGGGRPNNGATTVGGGGGGSGGASRMLIPAILLPDTIWVQPGAGGLGATTANTAGANGSASYVGVQPNTTQANIIFTQAGGGGGAAATTGGAAGGVGVNTGGPFGSLGLWYSIAGQGGNTGASALNGSANNTNTVFAAGIITVGGTGGGNGAGNGGTIVNGSAFFPQNINGGTGTTGGAGREGLQRGALIQQGLKNYPLFFTGGTGGGGHSTGTAGKGGDAAYGGGGGGGGGCSGAGTSGNGGNGGGGFIIIGTF